MKQRLLSGIPAAILFILFIVLGGYWYLTLLLLMALVGYAEFIRIHDGSMKQISSIIGIVAIATVVVMSSPQLVSLFRNSFESALWLLTFVLLTITVLSKNHIHIRHIFPVIVAVIYIGIGFHYMLFVRFEWGLAYTLFIFGCIWLNDTGAYLSGRWFGKRKLWPMISPKKTVEGAIGGILFSTLFALLFQWIHPIFPFFKAIVLAIVIAVVSQLGDLIQSAYKRVAGVKDSGRLLPGHGGILDRCDSWLIVFPFIVYFFLK